jgi:tRNA(Ile)-lysidine synthase
VTPAAQGLLAETAGAFPSDPFAVALSGGSDSAVLAWLSTQVQPHGQLVAIFVNHGWPDSDAMQAAAVDVAAHLGIQLECVRVAASATETSARELRLAALEEAAQRRRIVTGHHAGDLAETVLQNLARGAGAAGVASIPSERGAYVRPLLGATREQLRTAAIELGLPFRDDPANVDLTRQRNVIRSHVLPRLAEAVPGSAAGLLRSAQLAAADDALLEARVDTIPIRATTGEVAVPAAALSVLPLPVASRLVRRMIRLLHPPYAGDSQMVAAVLGTVAGPAVDLGRGLRAVREGPLVTVYDTTRPQTCPGSVALTVPGAARFGSQRVTARFGEAERVVVRGRHVTRLDAGLASDLAIRAPQRADRIDIGTGHKLVSDALNEAAVPRRLRSTWPLVTAHGKIAWIAGVRPAAWARPLREDGQVLELTTERR